MTNGKISLCRHSWSAQQISGDDFVEQDPLLFLVLDYVGEALVRWCIDLVYSLFHKYKIIAPFKGFLSKSMKCFAFILSLLLLSISNAVFVLDEEEQEHGNVRSRDLQDEDLDPNPDSWIVQFAPGTTGVANRAANLAKKNGGTVGAVFTTAIQGFVFNGKNVEGISQNPNVISVTRDSIHSVTAQSVPTGIKRIFATSKSYMTAATSSCFCDAVVAVIDTGVDFTHPDLKVDTKKSVDCTSGECVSGGLDGHGHGTHVSGTIGAINNGQGVVGVCPGALIWAVKVLNNRGSGYTSWIIKGIDYVAQNAATVDVANMSLGGSGCDQTYCSAITAAKNAGVAFAVAAGNSNDIADKYTPACCDDALSKFCLMSLWENAPYAVRDFVFLT
jgi:subtilisin family serine protease